jgi:hypothetical protein
MSEHIADRLARRARPFLIVALVLSGPVFLLSYVLLMRDMALSLGWWAAPVFVAHVLTWLGIASLLDNRQGR